MPGARPSRPTSRDGLLTAPELTKEDRSVNDPPRIGSLCSGYGGLDLAALSVFGGEVVWHAEVDPDPARVYEHRFPAVPNLGCRVWPQHLSVGLFSGHS